VAPKIEFFYESKDLGTPLRGEHRTHDCMDAGDRATQEAKAENRSVYTIHENSSTDDCMDAGGRATPGAVAELTQLSRKKAFSVALSKEFSHVHPYLSKI